MIVRLRLLSPLTEAEPMGAAPSTIRSSMPRHDASANQIRPAARASTSEASETSGDHAHVRKVFFWLFQGPPWLSFTPVPVRKIALRDIASHNARCPPMPIPSREA